MTLEMNEILVVVVVIFLSVIGNLETETRRPSCLTRQDTMGGLIVNCSMVGVNWFTSTRQDHQKLHTESTLCQVGHFHQSRDLHCIQQDAVTKIVYLLCDSHILNRKNDTTLMAEESGLILGQCFLVNEEVRACCRHQLKNVILESNHITNFTVCIAETNGNLWNSISLRNNSIEEIHISNHSLNLQKIDLSRNKLHYVDRVSFNCCVSLDFLNLSKNQLSDIRDGAFDGMLSLHTLDLSFNLLQKLNPGLFKKLDTLKFLDLSSNLLTQLPGTLPFLDWLDVSNNSITFLPESEFSKVLMPQAIFLIGNNPFYCNADMLWLKELIDTRIYLIKFYKQIEKERFIPICKLPKDLEGKYWDSLQDDDFQENSFTAKEFLETISSEGIKEEPTFHRKTLHDVKVEAIKYSSVTLKWKPNGDLEDSYMEIFYHKFGAKKKQKNIVVPLSSKQIRIKKLYPNTPYVICYRIVSGSENQVKDCFEIVTLRMNSEISQDISIVQYLWLQLHKDGINMPVVLVIVIVIAVVFIQYLKYRRKINKTE